MKIAKLIERIGSLTIEKMVHAVMVVFALASVGNVASFFIATNHHPLVAILMALALGTAVATTAIMLTYIDMIKQWRRYIAVGGMVLMLVGVSGFVQTQGYLEHGLSMVVSASMGFGIVFSGECLTAIALSLYRSAEQRRKIDEADSGLEIRLAEVFAEVLDDIDVTRSVRYMQRNIDKIVQYKADELLQQYIPSVTEGSVAYNSESVLHQSSATVTNADNVTPSATVIRRDKLLQLLSENVTPDDINKTHLAKELNTTRQTVGRDIDALVTAGRLSLNGVIEVIE